MSDAKDLAIKLFGKTISLPDIPAVSGDAAGAPEYTSGDILDGCIDRNHASSVSNSSLDSNTIGDGEEKEQEETDKDTFRGKPLEDRREDGALTQSSEVLTDPNAASRTHEDSITTPPIEEEATTLKTSKTEEQSEKCNSQEKTLKKPDKILPCPRCNSMETKFCYYNNYNVNQPRHFCKNCQRYWTAGGTMRDMPVGAGRRKNKNSTSHYHQITVSEALQNAPADLPYGVHHPSLKSNGPDTPLIESMAFFLNLADKTTHNCTINGFHKPQNIRIPFPYASEEKGNDHLNNSSATSTELKEDARVNRSQEQVMQNCQSFPPQVPSFSGPPCPSPWNLAPWSSAPPPPPAFCPPGFAIPFYPAATYWGCTISGAWTIPWSVQPSSPKSVAPNNGPDSPTLGKHSREGNMLKSSDSRGEYDHSKENIKCLWVPKTLRVDDPGEAAKSSIWTTLGIKNDEVPSVHKGGLFKAFPSKNNEKNHPMQTSPVLQANPAALSRSLNFHETS